MSRNYDENLNLSQLALISYEYQVVRRMPIDILLTKTTGDHNHSGERKKGSDKLSVYEKVKKLADAKGVSIAKVESETGMGNGVISGWKEDSLPSVKNLIKVADYFDVSLKSLIGD